MVVRLGAVLVAVTIWWLVLYHGVNAVGDDEYTRGGHVVRAVGATLGTVTLIYMLWLGWADLTVQSSMSKTVPALIALVALALLYEAVPEELIFRGYFFSNLAERWSTAITVIAQAVLFTLWGVLIGAATSIERVILFFAFSVVQGALRATTGNLWACIGFHATFQVATQFLGRQWNYIDLNDPDLSITGLSFVVIPFLCTAIVLWVVARKRRRN
ncbi:CPBP family intramembrane metalloprotease [Nocardia colli]|uniref:CPBP family intramembrane metalloprotease n=1 Tax=Nocardia colli TaxID=2545717 RepID=A0A5N0DRT8_9NOCA|nr:CPBP family intramembrane glutamic endopeptidase [Nocardia colli]KAA8879787.1 CPBP family intramembrane metalloprotease [Nocardia colli]